MVTVRAPLEITTTGRCAAMCPFETPDDKETDMSENTTKHTPDRLRVANIDGECNIESGFDGGTVAWDVNTDYAPLFAAVPDMLAALEAIFNMNPDNYDDPATIMRNYARAAIAKAKGE